MCVCEEGTGEAVMVLDVAAEEEIVMGEAAEEEARVIGVT